MEDKELKKKREEEIREYARQYLKEQRRLKEEQKKREDEERERREVEAMEVEQKRLEETQKRREEEEKERLEETERLMLEAKRRREDDARKQEEVQKRRDAEAREAEQKKREEEARKREAEQKKREEAIMVRLEAERKQKEERKRREEAIMVRLEAERKQEAEEREMREEAERKQDAEARVAEQKKREEAEMLRLEAKKKQDDEKWEGAERKQEDEQKRQDAEKRKRREEAERKRRDAEQKRQEEAKKRQDAEKREEAERKQEAEQKRRDAEEREKLVEEWKKREAEQKTREKPQKEWGSLIKHKETESKSNFYSIAYTIIKIILVLVCILFIALFGYNLIPDLLSKIGNYASFLIVSAFLIALILIGIKILLKSRKQESGREYKSILHKIFRIIMFVFLLALLLKFFRSDLIHEINEYLGMSYFLIFIIIFVLIMALVFREIIFILYPRESSRESVTLKPESRYKKATISMQESEFEEPGEHKRNFKPILRAAVILFQVLLVILVSGLLIRTFKPGLIHEVSDAPGISYFLIFLIVFGFGFVIVLILREIKFLLYSHKPVPLGDEKEYGEYRKYKEPIKETGIIEPDAWEEGTLNKLFKKLTELFAPKPGKEKPGISREEIEEHKEEHKETIKETWIIEPMAGEERDGTLNKLLKKLTELFAPKTRKEKPGISTGEIKEHKEEEEKEKIDLSEREKSTTAVLTGFPYDLKLVILWVILTAIFTLFPFLNETFLRIIFAWTMVLFLPGYVLMAFLFTQKKDLDLIERIALSFGLSAAITPVLGLILNFTPFGIRLLPIVVILSIFIILLSFLAHIKLKNIPMHAKYNENFNFRNIYLHTLGNIKSPEAGPDRILFIIMILSVVFCIFTLIFVITVPKQGERFTEFYILNKDGNANWYPTNLSVGEEGIVNINIVSHEHEISEYNLLIQTDNETLNEEKISINHNETWRRNFTFIAGKGSNKKLKFLLYKDNELYRNLHLWINDKDEEVDKTYWSINVVCGNGICEENETYETCKDDCKKRELIINCTMNVRPGKTITCTVTDEKDEKVPGATVLINIHDKTPMTFTTDKSGEVNFIIDYPATLMVTANKKNYEDSAKVNVFVSGEDSWLWYALSLILILFLFLLPILIIRRRKEIKKIGFAIARDIFYRTFLYDKKRKVVADIGFLSEILMNRKLSTLLDKFNKIYVTPATYMKIMQKINEDLVYSKVMKDASLWTQIEKIELTDFGKEYPAEIGDETIALAIQIDAKIVLTIDPVRQKIAEEHGLETVGIGKIIN